MHTFFQHLTVHAQPQPENGRPIFPCVDAFLDRLHYPFDSACYAAAAFLPAAPCIYLNPPLQIDDRASSVGGTTVDPRHP